MSKSKQVDSEEAKEGPPSASTCKREAPRLASGKGAQKAANQAVKGVRAQSEERDAGRNTRVNIGSEKIYWGNKLHLGNACLIMSVKYKTKGAFL